MRSIVDHHLAASPDACSIAGPDHWLHGSFNVCIPVAVFSSRGKKYPSGDAPISVTISCRRSVCPSNSDEKLRCEAGAYAWLQTNATDVPIPKMYGFALSTGETVCPPSNCIDDPTEFCNSNLLKPPAYHSGSGCPSNFEWILATS